MLGRTANGLFWMSRYLERAENTARLIETGQRISLTQMNATDDEWRSILQTAGSLAYFESFNHELTKDAAIDWLLRSKENPASIRSCIETARQNARMVRTAITGEVWAAINATYMRVKHLLEGKVAERDLPQVLREIKQNTALVRGMILGTMMRNEPFDFLRLGTFLERADNTARILDVKYYVPRPSIGAADQSIDEVQWESILRSASARGGLRMEYGPNARPQQIADFLILNQRFPRSLVFCARKLRDNLTYLNGREKPPFPAQILLNDLLEKKLSYDIETILSVGLHEYLQAVIGSMGQIAAQIEIDFRFWE